MKIRIPLLLSIFILSFTPMMAQKPAYQLFNSKGKKLKYKKVLKLSQEADVIFFGELHNNPIAHWLQYELLADLGQERGYDQLTVGAEMFESDQQAPLDKFLKGEIDAKGLSEATKLWPNYKTDYRPLVEFCKENEIPFIATNVPRRYARMVAMQGGPKALDSLPESEKALLTPLPFDIDYELPSYAAMRDMIGGHGGGMNPDHFIAAQAVKDATMAHFLLKNHKKGKLFYHLNGSYHSDSKEGIAWYVKQAQPDLQVFNLTTVEQAQLDDLAEEHLGKADVIIVVPERMTKTY
jgi:uncharacterized iron-regulated protein